MAQQPPNDMNVAPGNDRDLYSRGHPRGNPEPVQRMASYRLTEVAGGPNGLHQQA
jgi:hypothetical protein